MDEFDEYLGRVSIDHLIDAAVDLVDEPGQNSEYQRALVELLANVIGSDHDVTKYLINRIFKATKEK